MTRVVALFLIVMLAASSQLTGSALAVVDQQHNLHHGVESSSALNCEAMTSASNSACEKVPGDDNHRGSDGVDTPCCPVICGAMSIERWDDPLVHAFAVTARFTLSKAQASGLAHYPPRRPPRSRR
ncbi:hypothetical protein [Marinivivus vitaminiproducens]|uniref:hypothetical protein n=1 Tax=Marinivivus vitaminiproducens TaxID=3035935 RepID=UPI0027A16745|nr:hypothetical protein P4R82_25240 [Geminicoccaceae bacterium SCSIO 64248]